MKPFKRLLIVLTLLLLAPAAWAQNLFIQGDALSDRTYNSDNGPTNSQLTLDFTNAQAGVLQNILTWGETSGSSISGIGQSFEVFVLRPLNSTNYQVVFATGYLTVANVGINTFAVSGTPFGLQVGDVVAHYGRGIPFSNGTGGPSSVYIAANLPPPVLNTTITVPSATYPLYNDGGRNYAIQIQARTPLLVTTNSDGGPGSLRQAVLNANAGGGENIITFTNTLAGQTILLTSGQIVLNKNVTIDASALANGVAINGSGTARVFEVTNATVLLAALTITNGFGSDGGSYGGGGILNFGNLTLAGCTLSGNSESGGIGGAIDAETGTVTANECIFSGNSAHGSTCFGGGAIGIYAATVTLNQSTLSGNSANNSQNGGGGIFNAAGTLVVNQCTLSGNSANSSDSGGGGIYNNDGTLVVNQSTVAGNSANNTVGGGGINAFGISNAKLTNSIFAANTATGGQGADIFDNYTSLTFGGSNLVQAVIYTDNATVNGTYLTAAANLAPLGNYGGPTQTMPPLPGSAAIDAGSDSVTNFLATDQRGTGYPRLAGAHVDIGAVEAGDAILGINYTVVTTTSDFLSGLTNNGVSLRSAAACAPANSSITFASALSGQTIVLTNGQITIATNLTVDGSALANGVRIQNPSGRMFQINSSATVVMNSLTLMNGNCSSAGGAILNEGGNLTLNRSTLSGNLAQADGGGGAIFNDANSTLALNQCTLTANHAYQQGGAIYNFTPATLTLVNCTVSGNTADETSSPRGGTGGGGILNSGTLRLTNDIVAGNSDSVAANISGAFTGANNLTSGNPLLAALGNYGGPTPTMPPLAGSPAIDAGGSTAFLTDQRGFPRPVGLAVDIGAVEGVYNAAGPGRIHNISRLANGSVQLSFTNVTDAVFAVLATTNLTLSLSNWTQIGFATESPVGSGQFPFSDTQATNYPQRFYLISSP